MISANIGRPSESTLPVLTSSILLGRVLSKTNPWIFAAKWENETAKLACLIASYTGMRQGEIAALRLQDIGEDRIYIRHSWGKYDGLKTPKNGEEREIRIPHQLRDMIIMQAMKNP